MNKYKIIFNTVIILCLLISCFFENKNIITRKYVIDNNSIEDIILLPKKNNASILEIKIIGETNNEITFYYSHFPFQIEKSIKINGIINKNIRTDWYDNQCKVKIEVKEKGTKGFLVLKLLLL